MLQIFDRLSLRGLLGLDAVTCLVMGGLLLVAGGVLVPPLGLPHDLLFYAGLALLPVAAFMLAVAVPSASPAAGVFVVVAGNWLWVAASLALPLFGLVSPTGLGYAFLGIQAAAVAVLALAEQRAMARVPASTAAA